ncbi:DoxX family protein [Mesorhizobium sp.]|nr:DoxX family protein [Mesorhizobium sp.]
MGAVADKVDRGLWLPGMAMPNSAGALKVLPAFFRIPMPHLLAWLTTLVELSGGSAVLAGAFIPLVSVPMAVVLLTALFTVHSQYGFFSVKFAEVTTAGVRFGPVGYEIILLYLAGLATLAVGGPGRLSFEAVLRRPMGTERAK